MVPCFIAACLLAKREPRPYLELHLAKTKILGKNDAEISVEAVNPTRSLVLVHDGNTRTLVIELQPSSGTEVNAIWNETPGGPMVFLGPLPGSGESTRLKQIDHDLAMARVAMALESNQGCTVAIPAGRKLQFGRKASLAWSFELKPGTYRVRAVYSDSLLRMVSAWTDFEVIHP